MDELPARLRIAAGDEPVIETVDLGGGDALVVTTGATHVYRAEGLLSEESVESFRHDADRFAVQERRRKHTLVLESIDGERRFTVPSEAAEAVVEAVLEGILRTIGVVDPDEAVEAQFRFSELTLVVTDAALFKHVGPSVWNEDFELFDYDSLTGLAFEEGRVGTQVVVEIGGRQHRVKVPNERAGRVRRAVQRAVFAHYGVSSLSGLRAAVGTDERDDAEPEPVASVAEPRDEDEPDESVGTGWSPPADQDVTGPRGRLRTGSEDATADEQDDVAAASEAGEADGSTRTDADAEASAAFGPGDPDVADLAERVEELEAELARQTELLESHTETVEQLVEELRRGR
jgi:hypothetical protein